jgi:DNA repair ATPase RecN
MDVQINGSNDFGNSSNVVVLQHYSRSQQETAVLREQEEKIRLLEETIRTNDAKINSFKKGADELQLRINNIQAVDREIYKALQGSVNRDRELLDKAATALARGERREEVAKILQQIISP